MKTSGVALLLLCVSGCRASESTAAPAKVLRVGTYHAPSLVIAWVRSDEHRQELDTLVAARDAASKAGDQAKVAECERKGAESQDRAHRQLAGELGVEDILGRLEAELPAIRAKAGVERIAAADEAFGDAVELVDVTELLVECFHPDEATRKLLTEVRKYPKGVRVH